MYCNISIAEALRYCEWEHHEIGSVSINNKNNATMRKIKSFSLAQGHELSCEEMAMLEGGDFISFYCQNEYAACAIYEGDGVSTGTCYFVGIGTEKVLGCVKN